MCRLFASPQGEALIIHAFDTISPPMLALPSFLVSTNHQDITDTTHTPYQQAFNTTLPAFEFLAQPGREKQFDAFHTTMTAMQDASWMEGLQVLDAAAEQAGEHESPFFVDVGGGQGHQCIQFLKMYPALKGRVVLQDLSEAVSKSNIDGVTIQEQDFFTEQSVKG